MKAKTKKLPFSNADAGRYIDNTPPANKWDAKFREFHEANPHVYAKIKLYVSQAMRAGYTHYSIKAIFERIRWHEEIETKGDEFKLNNAFHAYYARLFHKDHPEHDGFFRTATLRCTAHA